MSQLSKPNWSFFGRISFRIAFIYYLLFFNPLQFLAEIPVLNWVPQLVMLPLDALVYFLNDQFYRIRPQLNSMGGGSGDTSFAWAMQFTTLLLGIFGAVIWTLFD